MKVTDLELMDLKRSRKIPTCVYLPSSTTLPKIPVVIFGHGYQRQEELAPGSKVKIGYKDYEYLAEFFTNKGYGFISIQHDLFGDKDGIDNINQDLNQYEARKHLYIRGEQNILFVIEELSKKFLELDFSKFMMTGHSNGGDIAKFFTNKHQDKILKLITFDSRRCPIEITIDMKILLFEANDTTMDQGVIPSNRAKRRYLEYVIIKPKKALHVSYNGSYITKELKESVIKDLDWFLSSRN